MKAEDFLSLFLRKSFGEGREESERLAKKITKAQSVRSITEGSGISDNGRRSYVG